MIGHATAIVGGFLLKGDFVIHQHPHKRRDSGVRSLSNSINFSSPPGVSSLSLAATHVVALGVDVDLAYIST